ncbi:MAG TPA: SEL1-like repeat protein [Burkholderiales bacterium]|nr:SEL1-like repeat protein [Burkholderiales bacterium]
MIILSSKATATGLARGQLEIQFFLGLAYLNGHIVERDQAKAVEWLTRAAASHVQARRLLDKINAQAVRASADASTADVTRSQ